MGSTRVETPIEQTELYHFAEGVLVDAEKFDGELAENQDVVLVSSTGQLPKCYYLPQGDWGEAPLVPGRNPPYEGINLAQALYAGIHNAAGDIAKAIGQLPLQDILIAPEGHDGLTNTFSSVGFFRVYLHLRLTTDSALQVARDLKKPEFKEKLNVDGAVTQPSLSKFLHERLTERQMEYFNGVVRRVLEEIENTEYGDAFADVPKPEVEGEEITPERKHIRSLREEAFQFISFDRDDSVKFDRDYLFQILNSAGLHNIFLNEACENMKTKPWLESDDIMDASNFRHQFRKFDDSEGQQRIERMFRRANDQLFIEAFEHEYFDDTNEIAIDSTDWSWYGDRDVSRHIQATKPSRNAYLAWQFTTLALVGTNTPMTIRATQVRDDDDRGSLVRRLTRYAAQVTSFNRAYLDSAFYGTDSVRALEDIGIDFVIQAPLRGQKIRGLRLKTLYGEDDVTVVPHGVGDIKDQKHWLFAVPSEKRSRLSVDGGDDSIVFYSNISPKEVDPHQQASDFRNRWGVETSYRKIKNDFLGKSGAEKASTRKFRFKFAVLLYNMWTMTNVLMAEEEGADLNEGNLVTANLFSRMIQDDKKMIEYPSEDKLPEGLEKLEWFNSY